MNHFRGTYGHTDSHSITDCYCFPRTPWEGKAVRSVELARAGIDARDTEHALPGLWWEQQLPDGPRGCGLLSA